MSKNKTVNILISVIGKGRLKKDQTVGYEQTEYVFNPDKSKKYIATRTAFFGIALYEYLNEVENMQIDKFILIGTDQSAWSELYQILPHDVQNSEDITAMCLKVYEEEKKGIQDNTLSAWQNTLTKYVPQLKFYKIKPLELGRGIDILLEELDKDGEYNVIFDMTHAFRNIPVVFSYGIMLLKYLRKINSIRIFYGAHDMRDYFSGIEDGQSPVIEIPFIDKLVRLIESMATFQNSGYFVPLLEQIGLGDREKTYFKLEMNRQPRREIEEIIKGLEDKQKMVDHSFEKEIVEIMYKEFSEMNRQEKLFQRMYKRSQFFYERRQYLKALILLYEAIIVLFADVYKIKDNMGYDAREEARKKLKLEMKNVVFKSDSNKLIKEQDEARTIEELEYLRNAAVHGSSPRGNQNYLENVEEFKLLLNSAMNLFEKMLKRRSEN
ncbi:CRISPR-associated protein DxTHG motif [Caldicellulosiruptor obsidiansis OB47]|uniref:CRISPR-associated protein DxTHG motif n=1 Tax=Caldicellulosiruptor obsidiansis (strain ATCC BAA-2073 / JCM 16842 / OB47) TaxID=608506 RepID=D9THM6_CALOO|nr:TIGR02221 family CRISPR-associated protein [Caldicellulosiruptor obsidiansis]ADL43501.1 CRISPR-associated protein DxTHG motif [Caldicellulosiruptor obsidiansis OB47]